MRLQLLYFDGCPNWQVMEARLRAAVTTSGRTGEVERVLVRTPEEATALAFHGSPSVLVDGRDPFAEADAPVGLLCRIYRTPDGLAGSPTTTQLIEVLSRG